MYIHIEL